MSTNPGSESKRTALAAAASGLLAITLVGEGGEGSSGENAEDQGE